MRLCVGYVVGISAESRDECVTPMDVESLIPRTGALSPPSNIDCIGFLWSHCALLNLLIFFLMLLLCLKREREVNALVHFVTSRKNSDRFEREFDPF